MNIEAIKMHVKVKVTGKKRDAAPQRIFYERLSIVKKKVAFNYCDGFEDADPYVNWIFFFEYEDGLWRYKFLRVFQAGTAIWMEIGLTTMLQCYASKSIRQK